MPRRPLGGEAEWKFPEPDPMRARDSANPVARSRSRAMRHSALTRRLDVESARVWDIHYLARERR